MGTLADVMSETQKEKLTKMKEVVKTENAHKKRFEGVKRVPIEEKIPYLISRYGESTIKLALMIKNNAEFRRMISIAIKHNLKANGEITDNDKVYVTYFWNKFSVKVNGLSREYFYTTPLFLNNFCAAIVMISNYAQTIAANFAGEKGIDVDLEYANNILDHVAVKNSEEPEGPDEEE